MRTMRFVILDPKPMRPASVIAFILCLAVLPAAVHGRARKPCKPHMERKVEKYPSGQPNRVCSFYRDRVGRSVQHGFDAYYFEDGKPMSKCIYKHGVRQGTGVFWHESGMKKKKGRFLDGHKDGLWTVWNPDETRHREVNFNAGKRHGPFTEWHDNGAIAVQGRYEHGAKQGRFRHWHADRSSQAEFIYRKGRREGRAAEWCLGGGRKRTMMYREDQLSGESQWRRQDGGALASCAFRNGAPWSGTAVESSTAPNCFYLTSYADGDIIDQRLYENGKPKTGTLTEWNAPKLKRRVCQ